MTATTAEIIANLLPMKSVREQLAKPMQGSKEHYSFGSWLATHAGYGDQLKPGELSHAAKNEARAIRLGTRRLLESSHDDDQIAVDVTADRFNSDDMTLFLFDTDGDLSTDPKQNILKWIASSETPFRDIALLAIWNRSRRNQFQQQLDEDGDRLSDQILKRVDYLIGEGVFPAGSKQHYGDVAARYGNYKALDSFESGFVTADGYCTDNIRAIANLYSSAESLMGLNTDFIGVGFHEDTHAAGWHGRGFFHGMVQPHNYHRIWEEFVTSHFQAVTSADGNRRQPRLLDPLQRRERHRSYFNEGIFVSTVNDISDGHITADLIGHAFFSPLDESNPPKPRQQLYDTIVDAIGSPEAFYEIGDTYEEKATHRERNTFLNLTTARLMAERAGVLADFENMDDDMVGFCTIRKTAQNT